MPDPADAALARQYEAYPYPARDPRDEKKRLVVGSPSHLREIDHWVFGAARPADRPLRALFAGGGTGDGAIMLAAQLQAAGRPGHVTHLDRSETAQRIAAARAEARDLRNIDFVPGALPGLPAAARGPFDYIDCCGVLHHLPDPEAALAALTRVLAPGGGMGLMVYAPYGRTGVYELQDALRTLAPLDAPPADRLDIARRVMRHLPPSAWLRQNRNFGDHLTGGDAGLYDLLLNPRDRAYDLAAFAALIGSAGLQIAALIEPVRYDPDLLLPDPRLRARTASLGPIERAGLAERLVGNMATHIAYAVRALPPGIDPMAPGAVPIGRETPAAVLAERVRGDVLPLSFAQIALPPGASALLRLIDGERSVEEIAAAAAANGIPARMFDRMWPALFRSLEAANRLVMKIGALPQTPPRVGPLEPPP
jgi:SAM-dependent methyltransferase